MIGLVYSRLNDAQNIGYIIPNEEIELFLKDIADGSYDGKYFVLYEMQTFENPALRKFLKLDAAVHGLLVKKPNSDDANYPSGDLVQSVNGINIKSLKHLVQVPIRIHKLIRIIIRIRIAVKAMNIVFLKPHRVNTHKPPNHWVVIPCPHV